MLGILLFIGAIIAIGALARKRDTSPFLWPAIALIGGLTIGFMFAPATRAEFVRNLELPNLTAYIPTAAVWTWVGLVALYVRFGIGFENPKPKGMWTCPECKSLNSQNALFCDACRLPWSEGQ